MDVSGHTDRRIGVRWPAFDVALVWRADADDRRHFRRFWPGRLRSERAGVIDVSLTGARLVASTPSDLMVGSMVVIEIDGHRGWVRVRRMAATADPSRTMFGVDFAQLSPGLARLLTDRISAAVNDTR